MPGRLPLQKGAGKPFYLHLTGIRSGAAGSDVQNATDLANFDVDVYNENAANVVSIMNANTLYDARWALANYWEVRTALTCLEAASNCGVPVQLSSFSNGASGVMQTFRQMSVADPWANNVQYYVGIAPNLRTNAAPCKGVWWTPNTLMQYMDTAATILQTNNGMGYHYFIRQDDGALAESGWLWNEITLLNGAMAAVGSVGGGAQRWCHTFWNNGIGNHSVPAYAQTFHR